MIQKNDFSIQVATVNGSGSQAANGALVKKNDFSIQVATVNGSGSQAANGALVKALFRSGVPVGSKNLFPSNIAGLPTWFSIRISRHGFTGRTEKNDIVIAMNPSTWKDDLSKVNSNGCFIYNSDLKFDPTAQRNDVQFFALPIRELVTDLSKSVKLKKLLGNMVYLGFLAELIGLDGELTTGVIQDQFSSKPEFVDINLKAIQAGRNHVNAISVKKDSFPFQISPTPEKVKSKILIDGNSAAALGLLCGGGSLMFWYPITPSSSLAEAWDEFSKDFRIDESGKKKHACVQTEDELSAICMVLGAGWAGARAVTTTSGPGLSLMAEAAGLAYFAEIPAVIWDVQRVGPSTGLPTRTMQADLLSAYTLSHGDSKHVVLIPSSPKECFEFGQTCFDLAERLQTLVVVLSDLDLGMNLHIGDEFSYPEKPFDRGKVLTKDDLDKVEKFARYADLDGDGISFRTLPGTEHPLAAYFTRGTGHDESANYSEDPKIFEQNMDRLNKKWETARTLVPPPILTSSNQKTSVGLIAYGSTDLIMEELIFLLASQGVCVDYLKIRALPINEDVNRFLAEHDRVYVIEQNSNGQMSQILRQEVLNSDQKIREIKSYTGLPLAATEVLNKILPMERERENLLKT